MTQNNSCDKCNEIVDNEDQLPCGHYVHMKCLYALQQLSNCLFLECYTCKKDLETIEIKFPFDTLIKMYSEFENRKLYNYVIDKSNVKYRMTTNVNNINFKNIKI